MLSTAAKKTLVAALAGAALASALVVPSASGYQALRSGDTNDAAQAAAGQSSSVTDATGNGSQNLRSPDTRDHAEDYTAASEPQAVVGEPGSSGGFDVVSALLGAAAGAGLLIVLLAAGTIARRRPSAGRQGSVGA